MKAFIIILILSFAILIFIFRGLILKVATETSLPDQNPQLVSDLQGDWAFAENQKSVFQIKRDSLIELYNDSVKTINSLRYLFSEPASKYFTKDSSFDFSSQNKPINDFKLIATNSITGDTTVYILKHVSKSMIKMNSVKDSLTLVRLNHPR